MRGGIVTLRRIEGFNRPPAGKPAAMETPRDESSQYEPEEDPDTDPTTTEEKVERDVERDQTEGE